MTEVTEPGDGAGLTFEAFARQIGKSRPYVSKLVAAGRIRPPALTADRKIIADLAKEQIAEGADPARGPAGVVAEKDGTYAKQRARKTAADAELAELDLAKRRGELIERSAVAEALSPLLRKLRDDLVGVPRDIVIDPEQAACCEEAIAAVLDRTATEIMSYGGASPAG